MKVHRISSNNQTSFGMIFLNNNNTQEVVNNDFKQGTKLGEIYNELMFSQKENPVNIIIDTFEIDKNEIPMDNERWDNWYWYLKATVGKRVFEQKTTSSFTNYQPSITFLKKACLYADFLNKKQKLLKFLKLGK